MKIEELFKLIEEDTKVEEGFSLGHDILDRTFSLKGKVVKWQSKLRNIRNSLDNDREKKNYLYEQVKNYLAFISANYRMISRNEEVLNLVKRFKDEFFDHS